MAARRVMVVFGTRPEAVKLAPVVDALRSHDELAVEVVVTAQHREMLDQVLELFDIEPDADLDLHRPGQSLTEITVGCLEGLAPVLADRRPDAVVVQGDTTSSFAGALAAFYAGIRVAHVEAGLRTGDRQRPWPEEVNRRLVARLADLHLAPTPVARGNLVGEGVDPGTIAVTGNTVIDALLGAVRRPPPTTGPGSDVLAALDREPDRRIVVVTVHRRESWGEPLHDIAAALADIARAAPDVLVVVPMHRNPGVRAPLTAALGEAGNVLLTEPLPYGAFSHLLARSWLVVTDSGGIQEEAPSLGRPVLVLRETTERPEAVTAGTVRLVGTAREAIAGGVMELLGDAATYDAMARAVNPYGDGHAAGRVVAAIAELLGVGTRLPDFVPPS
jgi:UDP-N-acetylglucosamine 2-epimerase (non-hydrolysing)